MTNEKKKELADEFLSCLDTHIGNKASDAASDCNDSFSGMASWKSGQELEKALHALLEIEVEEEVEEEV